VHRFDRTEECLENRAFLSDVSGDSQPVMALPILERGLWPEGPGWRAVDVGAWVEQKRLVRASKKGESSKEVKDKDR